MSQTNHKSSVMGIVFGFGIVIAFLIVILMVGKDDIIKVSESESQQSGKAIYDKSCIACHGSGVLNAPKLGNQADWEHRILKGEKVLLQNAINGLSSMPPRGGAFLNDEELKLALSYMLASVTTETVVTPKVVDVVKTEPSAVKPVANVDTKQHAGKSVYDKVCMACHNAGLLNAPKLANKDDWTTRITKGEATLLQNSINGINAMPPRGGNFVSDADMKLAVQYMLASVEEKTSEPTIQTTPSQVKQVITTPVDIKKHAGKSVYDKVCMACHNAGLLNAPKLANKDDWTTRITKGEATLLQNSINGINAMPPRGGNFVSDADMKLAVQYMLASVGAETSEPMIQTAPSPVKQVVTKPVAKVFNTPKPAPKVVSRPQVVEKPVSTTPIANSPKQGKDIYEMTCKSCHVVGIAGAPKIAEKKDWKTRLPKGENTLIQNAINGLNIMPPKGGNVNLTNEEVKLAVQYMLEVVGK
ncbi:c-type cytochrome [Candidatus Halobeggiatoa sp. HSG11]|nr:c-type cytochrome [Candidatus Halobeggiatoa sp. HSG11]